MQQIVTFYPIDLYDLFEYISGTEAKIPEKTKVTEVKKELENKNNRYTQKKTSDNMTIKSSGSSVIKPITKAEFIEKLKKCFEILYHDRYLAVNIAFMDDSNLKSSWKEEVVNEAKRYYASDLQDDEHIFLLKPAKAKLYRNIITKNFADELSGGFIITDKYMYIDENIYKKPIELMNIMRFACKFQPSDNEYLLSVIYYDGAEKERYLLKIDSRAVKLCELMNEFLYNYRLYYNKIIE